jgi:DNA-binding MarR family transcriptional regulator
MDDHVALGVEQWQALRPDLDLAGMEVFGRIYRLARVAEIERTAALEPHGLQLGDVDVLAPLFRYPDGLRPRELRNAMMVGSGTLTPRIDRLEATGLLRRDPDPDDRRGRILRLTARGRRVTPRAVAVLLEVENRLLSGLPARERHQLAAGLSRLLGSIDDPDG